MNSRILKLRECSAVERCHVVKHVGSYSVGQHSFDAALLLLELYPEASRNLLIAVMRHDLAERWTGDMPASVKWDNPALASALAEAERRITAREHLTCGMPALTPGESLWLAIVDRLELWLWAKEQAASGSYHVKPMIDRLKDYFDGLEAQDRLPDNVRTVLETMNCERTNDCEIH